ncbi:MFS transporter [Hafnia alvei]|uniref:MFS transporter n=1 Tax=Hafnia alvei TaxID=569 RepID=UPI00061D1A3C|nr:MFS transporter [Hafnia alvei]KID01077.2 MFS transporter [Hafnia alvei]MBW3477454.1 MFS transporter [Hafnia alvei]MDU3158087.1 MFS transporter [Hafnia alvei]TBL47373.1 MFS transporter [Hafnia alvei]TBM18329.1 MFS transporter [Hafnia alvei]
MSTSTPSAAPSPIAHRRGAELALAVGGFGIGTGEFAIMGLLPNVAKDLAISIPQAGHVISIYALGVVIGAPVIATLAARLSRRTLLLLLMVLFAVGNIASALSSSYGNLMVFRFISGLPHGAYFGVASLVAASMADVGQRAKAVGRVMLGLTLATLLGSPLATWIGQLMGWRAAFVMVGVIGALTALLVMLWLPKDKVEEGASPLRELGALKRKQVWLTLGIAAVGSGGLFAVFSYIAPTLIHQTGMSPASVPLVLIVFGVGMILGNIFGSRLADRSLMGTIVGVLIWNVVILTTFYLVADIAWATVLVVLLTGGSFALVPALQTRLMDVAEDAQTLAAALNHSAFNIANALGAWLGGVSIAAGFGWSSTGWVGAGLAAGGILLFLWSYYSDPDIKPKKSRRNKSIRSIEL